MKMTIIGGGNIGTLLAAEMAHKGHDVTIYSSKAELWNHEISVMDSEENVLLKGCIVEATSSMEKALKDAEVVWITMPSQTFEVLVNQIAPYAKKGQKFGIVPGSGGAEFAFSKLIEKQCVLFGLQRVHSIARLKEYGKSVYMLGRKSELQVGVIPVTKTFEIAKMLEQEFNMPCVPLPNYLSVTLTPSNPILHTTRLFTLFHNYHEGKTYPRNYLFYEEWDDESSQMLIACDIELQNLCKKIPMDLTAVKSLREHYQSENASAMTKKISTITAFLGMKSPMKFGDSGWTPDFDSRYFTADFSYGLKVIQEISNLFCVPTPNIDRVWNWYKTVSPENANKAFQMKLSMSDFLQLYSMDY